MKVGPFIAGALILCIALSSEIEAKGKKAKFCKGENGKRYAKGEGYKDKGACKRYTCVKQGKKLKMKETKIPCGGDTGDMAASLQFLNSSMESMEGKLRDLQTSLESILEKMTAMQSASDKHESCLADTTSSECPAAPSGKVSVSGAITALETPTVFSCLYTSPGIYVSGTVAPYAACDVNVGNVMDNTTGTFTVAKPGKYRLTFMTVMAPQEMKKVSANMVKTTGGMETILGRALAQSKIGYELQLITTTLDIIVELAALDTVHVAITVSRGVYGGASIPDGSYIPQTFFMGEYISA